MIESRQERDFVSSLEHHQWNGIRDIPIPDNHVPLLY